MMKHSSRQFGDKFSGFGCPNENFSRIGACVRRNFTPRHFLSRSNAKLKPTQVFPRFRPIAYFDFGFLVAHCVFSLSWLAVWFTTLNWNVCSVLLSLSLVLGSFSVNALVFTSIHANWSDIWVVHVCFLRSFCIFVCLFLFFIYLFIYLFFKENDIHKGLYRNTVSFELMQLAISYKQ